MREAWKHALSTMQGFLHCVLQLQGWLTQAGELAKENLQVAQGVQEQEYNIIGALWPAFFVLSNRILILLPSEESKLLAHWHSPYEVICQMGQVTCKIKQSDLQKKKQTYHVNLLKLWQEREGLLIAPYFRKLALTPDSGEPQLADTLSTKQQKARCLLRMFPKTFTATPGQTTLIHCVILAEPGTWSGRLPDYFPECGRLSLQNVGDC